MIVFGVAVSVLLAVTVGLTVSRKVGGNSTNFLVAGRSLALPLVAVGLMGQAVDTNATLGNTDLTAQFGFWAGASLPLGLALCLVLTGLFFAAPMNRMGLLTLGDYYRLRYGRMVELPAALLMIVSFCILLAGNLVAGGFLFERFLGTSYTVGVLLLTAVVVSYTVAGGMFSDAYASFTQMLIAVAAAIGLLIWVAVTYGLSAPDGLGPFDFGQLTESESGAVVNWATLLALGVGDIVAIDFMQRIFAARSPETARRACYAGAIGTAVVGIPYALVALSTAAILGPDATASGPVLLTLLDELAPTGLTILVLAGIVAASCSTADGAILGTAAVAVRNVAGLRAPAGAGRDGLLRATRLAFVPVVGFAILLALRVPETGILLVLAFDVMLASLAVPFVLGHWWSRSSPAAALAAIVVGGTVRLVLFVLTPTVYGADNTILYVDNSLVGAGFDGWPTFLAFGAAVVAFVAAALLGPRREPAAGAVDEPAGPVTPPRPATTVVDPH